MDAKEFLAKQLDTTGYQLQAVFAGFPDGKWDERTCNEAMSAKETAEHLAECYVAFLDHCEGREHEWGSFKPASSDPEKIVAEMFELRAKAIATFMARNGDDVLGWASDYIVLHDPYHVGQMCSLRLELGEFSPYSIYKMD
ncbi:MAG: DinB family protein [Armatimonadetes bacterium]|nr:DinB family protein [Armatimonadota bacterium]MBS1710218.1 DinB family protein [Armatimonadota bacterium]MBX3110108.1 DinB family protein [Fimbriimonadaceae bacterium]